MSELASEFAAVRHLVGDLPFDPDALRDRYRMERDKRLRDEGPGQYQRLTGSLARFDDDPFVDGPNDRAPVVGDVEVVVVGTGFAGLLAAARLREAGIDDIRLLDRAGDVGGTWYWNRYPGVNCDIESYIYLPLLEETGYIPRHKYSFGHEILDYCRLVARQYDLYPKALFRTTVDEMRWDETVGRWQITTDIGDRLDARFVVFAGGGTSTLKLPRIPGITEYRGHVFHTSRWDYSYTGGDQEGNTYLSGDATSNMDRLADKRVAIIGTGATAVQCVPPLAAAAQHLYVFQRTPSSIDVRANVETDLDWYLSQEPGWQQRRMDNFISFTHEVGEGEDLVSDGWTDIQRRITGLAVRAKAAESGHRLNSAERRLLMELADFEKMEEVRARAAASVADPDTAEDLMPWYRQFCKRPCFHDGYLASFNRPNVTLVDTDGEGVERLTEHGVVAGSKEYEVDCIIFATGFETNLRIKGDFGFDIVGRNGETLREKWARQPITLHGLQTHGFPNLFLIPGPLGPITFLIPYAYNEQARHAAYLIEQTRRAGGTVIEATEEGEQGWLSEVQRSARPGIEFYEACTPGYYNNEGKIAEGGSIWGSLYQGGPRRYLEVLRDWRDAGNLAGVEVR